MFSLLRSKPESDLSAKLVRMIKDEGEDSQIKRIKCIAGEELKSIGNEFYCKNKLIAKDKEYSLGGEKLKKFEFTGKFRKAICFWWVIMRFVRLKIFWVYKSKRYNCYAISTFINGVRVK